MTTRKAYLSLQLASRSKQLIAEKVKGPLVENCVIFKCLLHTIY